MDDNELDGIRGWLLVYVVVLAGLFFHGVGLTIAAVVEYVNSGIAGTSTIAPLSFIIVYVVTNVILAAYTLVLYLLMFQRKRSAIINNVFFDALSVLFLIVWLLLGEKSHVGTLIDALPGVVGAWYFLVSRRVRNTFTKA